MKKKKMSKVLGLYNLKIFFPFFYWPKILKKFDGNKISLEANKNNKFEYLYQVVELKSFPRRGKICIKKLNRHLKPSLFLSLVGTQGTSFSSR